MSENPFEVTKAVFFKDKEIQKYWVDFPDSGGFRELAKPTSLQPMRILGGKGSGKTHLLRYYSYRLQKIRNSSNVILGIKRDGYIGNYTLLDGLNSSRFTGNGLDSDTWISVFRYYFDLFLSENLLLNIIDLKYQIDGLKLNEKKICESFKDIFITPVKQELITIEDIKDFVSKERKSIDYKVANVASKKSIEVDIKTNPGELIFGLPKILSKNSVDLESLTFLYILDELENITIDQQVYINSLVRGCIPPVSLKIGSRLYGVKTENTYSDEEEIKEGSEFDNLVIDYELRSSFKNYNKFSRHLLESRVSTNSIEKIEIDNLFEKINQYSEENEKLRIIKSNHANRDSKKYFRKLRNELNQLTSSIDFGDINQPEIDKILDNLSFPKNILLEKLNCFLFYKAISSKENLVDASEKIHFDLTNFVNNGSIGNYKYSYDQWKFAILAQLLRQYNYKPSYSGLDNIISMSDGFPRVLLMTMKKVYEKSQFLGEDPNQFISIKAQDDGILEASNWFFKDATPKGKEGIEVRESIDKLATFFKDFNFSDKPSEKPIISFSYDSSSISEVANNTIELARKWSLLVEFDNGHKGRNSNRILRKLRLNKMLCPRWMLPISTGGTIEFNTYEIEMIFNSELESRDVNYFDRRLNKLNFPFSKSKSITLGLFDD